MVLDNEVNLIRDLGIREWTQDTLKNVPEYFWRAMASSTGKYHPACACKVGGLITHVKRAVYIADRLCTGYGLVGIDRDIVLSATILHDIAKVPSPKEDPSSTYEKYENHPLNAKQYFSTIEDKNGYIECINFCIRNHMGLWTPASIKKPIKEYSLLELVVYTADYMSATKDLVTPKDNE
jgi:23S rRNA maturation-related 3'-5' exoribonuclease YhaM